MKRIPKLGVLILTVVITNGVLTCTNYFVGHNERQAILRALINHNVATMERTGEVLALLSKNISQKLAIESEKVQKYQAPTPSPPPPKIIRKTRTIHVRSTPKPWFR